MQAVETKKQQQKPSKSEERRIKLLNLSILQDNLYRRGEVQPNP